MSDLLVLCACISFALFLLTGERYAAIAGWACTVANLWSELPAFLFEDNFLYPVLAFLSLPFLAITAERLLRKDPVILQLTRTAAIATLIWVPFALIPVLHDGLISIVVTLVYGLVTALGHHPELYAWDVIAENGFYNQIILGCTGILVIAMVLGVTGSERTLTLRQAVPVLFILVPVIFLLNLLRVAVVFIAVSDRWFTGFPDPTGTGDAHFFWAHNVIAEGLAVLFLVVLLRVLARIIPRLGTFARALVGVYRDRLRGLVATARDTL